MLLSLPQVAIVLAVFGVACAHPQVLYPTAVSQQSGIVRTIPTTLIGVPVSSILTDRDRLAISTQLQIEQIINNRINNNQNRDIQDQIIRDIVIQNQQRINNRINGLNDQVADQLRAEQIIRTTEQLRNEQIRDELDRNDANRQVYQNNAAGNAAIATSKLRNAVSRRLV